MAHAEKKLNMSLEDLIKEDAQKKIGQTFKARRGDRDRERPRRSGPAPSAAAPGTLARVPGGGKTRGIISKIKSGGAAPMAVDRPARDVGLGVRSGGVRKQRAPLSTGYYEDAGDDYGAPREARPRPGGSLRRGVPPGNVDGKWQHDLFDANQPRRRPAPVATGRGVTILVSNLDYQVNDKDIRELFESCGELVKAGVNYDHSDRSEGTATVVFANRAGAEQALRDFNGVALDGRVLKLELVEGAAPNAVRQLSSGRVLTRPNEPAGNGRGGGANQGNVFRQSLNAAMPRHGGMGGSSGSGGYGAGGRPAGRGGRLRSAVGGGARTRTKEELDAELDNRMQMD